LKAPLLVWALAVAFLLLVTSLLIGSFTKPEFPPYEIGISGAGGATSVFAAITSSRLWAPEPSTSVP